MYTVLSISYVRPHIDQNTQESRLRLELQRKMDFHTKKRDRPYKEKKATIDQKKGMAHRKRAWRSKKRAWRSAMLKGPRGNTKVLAMNQGLKYLKIGTCPASQKLLAYMGKKIIYARNIKIFTCPAARGTRKYERTSAIF